MCHVGWVSDVGMIGKNMSRTAKRVLATGRHTSAHTCRIAEAGEVGLLGTFLRASIDLRSDNTTNSASASFLSACRQRAARLFECSLTCSRMHVTSIALSKIM